MLAKIINNINWSIFWEAASAIATTVAVFVALWQTKNANKKKAKIDFCENYTIVPNTYEGKAKKNQYVNLSVTNLGNRKIVIKEVGIVQKNNCRAVIQPEITVLGQVQFPVELDVEQSFDFPISKNNFFKIILNTKQEKNYRRIIFYILDSSGKKYVYKTKKTFAKYITIAKKEGCL